MAAGACAPRSSSAPHRYQVGLDPSTSRVDATVCFGERVPARLVPSVASFGGGLERAWRVGDAQPLPVSAEGVIALSGLSAGDCVGYRVNIASSGPRPTRLGARYGEHTLLIDPDRWLWRAEPQSPAPPTLSFVLPAGHAVSAPWPTVPSRAGTGTRLLGATAFDWSSRVAIGPFERRQILVGGATLDVAVLPGARSTSLEGIDTWLREAARAVAGVHGGQLPLKRVQVVVAPVAGRSSVLFGTAYRGGGPGLVLLLGAQATDDALPGEWVAVHELFHLGMPFIDRADAWLSEGVTTYFQEIARARAGLRTLAQCRENLLDGFRRGAGAGTGLSLADESRAMHKNRAFWRVYWGGAAIALAWDVALRRQSGGKRSLAAGIAHLGRCCAGSPRVWSAASVIAELEQWSGSSELSAIADRALGSRDFPAFDPATITPELVRW